MLKRYTFIVDYSTYGKDIVEVFTDNKMRATELVREHYIRKIGVDFEIEFISENVIKEEVIEYEILG